METGHTYPQTTLTLATSWLAGRSSACPGRMLALRACAQACVNAGRSSKYHGHLDECEGLHQVEGSQQRLQSCHRGKRAQRHSHSRHCRAAAAAATTATAAKAEGAEWGQAAAAAVTVAALVGDPVAPAPRSPAGTVSWGAGRQSRCKARGESGSKGGGKGACGRRSFEHRRRHRRVREPATYQHARRRQREERSRSAAPAAIDRGSSSGGGVRGIGCSAGFNGAGVSGDGSGARRPKAPEGRAHGEAVRRHGRGDLPQRRRLRLKPARHLDVRPTKSAGARGVREPPRTALRPCRSAQRLNPSRRCRAVALPACVNATIVARFAFAVVVVVGVGLEQPPREGPGAGRARNQVRERHPPAAVPRPARPQSRQVREPIAVRPNPPTCANASGRGSGGRGGGSVPRRSRLRHRG